MQTATSGSMSLVIKNLQKAVRLNVNLIEKNIKILRHILKIQRFDVSVLFVTNNYMKSLNEKYRHVSNATDVLAFPALELVGPGIFPPETEMTEHDETDLGDIVLAPAYIQHHCQIHKDNFDHVFMTTINHGLCHLIGHDHETEEDQLSMVETERAILEQFNKLTGYSCIPLTSVGH